MLKLLLLIVSLLMTSWGHSIFIAVATAEEMPAALAGYESGQQLAARVHWQPGLCRDNPALAGASAPLALNGEAIKLLSWNIAKGSREGWRADLRRLSAGKDLVLLQEALLGGDFASAVAGERDFSPGYRTSRYTSGVMTAASATALSFCSLQSREPLLTTPKMALVTEYPLAGRDDTLMVANIHAVNFSLGLGELRKQLRQVAALLAAHDGPQLFAGDFNTWSGARLALLRDTVAELGLESAAYANDHRRQAFGYALDHLFFRGLSLSIADSEPVSSSDHNPIVATLALAPAGA